MSSEKVKLPSISGSSVSISNASSKGSSSRVSVVEGGGKGFGFFLASFFMVAQMAGAGFVALPSSLAQTGWLGALMMLIFGISIGFSASRLGKCWLMLEERWPEYKKPAKQPYMEMAYVTMGVIGRRVALIAVWCNLYGVTTVFILVSSGMIAAMGVPLSECELILIIGCGFIPLTWLGTPKDFWQTAVIAVVSTVLACITIVVLVIVENGDQSGVTYPNPTAVSFSLGFSTVLYAFSGAAVFPTIQNDMQDRTQFSKSVVLAFATIISLYLPVAVTGYAIYGIEVNDNIFLSIENMGPVLRAAISLEIINLFSSYIVAFNPVAQSVEEILHVPNKFGWQRIVLRSSLVLGQIVICLAIPSFSKIVNLIGGSCITICSFVFPPIMYLRLMDMEGPWPKREVPLWQRVFLIEIVIVGIIGGVLSTVSAVAAIVAPGSLSANCFVEFYAQRD